MAKVYVGSVAPEALDIPIARSGDGPDMTTVTAVRLHVQCGSSANAQTRTWDLVIVSTSANSLLARRVFAAGDLHRPGTWRMYAELTVPGGTVRTRVGELEVVPRFGS